MRLLRQLLYVSRLVFPVAFLSMLLGCGPGYELGDIESEIDACKWAVAYRVADEVRLSLGEESMESVIWILKGYSERWVQDAGFFLETVELADKEVEKAITALNDDKGSVARSHIDSAIWLLRGALKEADRLGFDLNLGWIESPDSPVSRGIREEEGREKKISLPPGDRPWDPVYMDSQPPPAGYLIEGDFSIKTYLGITLWRLQLAKDQLI
jgi:hypothetical protein